MTSLASQNKFYKSKTWLSQLLFFFLLNIEFGIFLVKNPIIYGPMHTELQFFLRTWRQKVPYHCSWILPCDSYEWIYNYSGLVEYIWERWLWPIVRQLMPLLEAAFRHIPLDKITKSWIIAGDFDNSTRLLMVPPGSVLPTQVTVYLKGWCHEHVYFFNA